MTIINVQSIKDAVSKGALIDLVSDYRTAGIANGKLSPTCSTRDNK
jgi:hypothetical protein